MKLFKILILILLLGLCGCTTKEQAVNSTQAKAKRIISTSPSNTEILVGLGLSEKIIAVDTFSEDVEGLGENVVYMDFQYSANAEQLISLKPDVIFASEINTLILTKSVEEALQNAGINVVNLKTPQTINEIYEQIEQLGTLTKTEDKAQEMIEQMQQTISNVEEAVSKIQNKKTVYFEISPAPELYSFGSNTFLNELLEKAGGTNIFAEKSGWLAVNEEAVLQANPDVILTNIPYDPPEMHVSYIDKNSPLFEIPSRKHWDNINAVKNEKIALLDANITSRPSQNAAKAILEIFEAIYPEFETSETSGIQKNELKK